MESGRFHRKMKDVGFSKRDIRATFIPEYIEMYDESQVSAFGKAAEYGVSDYVRYFNSPSISGEDMEKVINALRDGIDINTIGWPENMKKYGYSQETADEVSVTAYLEGQTTRKAGQKDKNSIEAIIEAEQNGGIVERDQAIRASKDSTDLQNGLFNDDYEEAKEDEEAAKRQAEQEKTDLEKEQQYQEKIGQSIEKIEKEGLSAYLQMDEDMRKNDTVLRAAILAYGKDPALQDAYYGKITPKMKGIYIETAGYERPSYKDAKAVYDSLQQAYVGDGDVGMLINEMNADEQLGQHILTEDEIESLKELPEKATKDIDKEAVSIENIRQLAEDGKLTLGNYAEYKSPLKNMMNAVQPYQVAEVIRLAAKSDPRLITPEAAIYAVKVAPECIEHIPERVLLSAAAEPILRSFNSGYIKNIRGDINPKTGEPYVSKKGNPQKNEEAYMKAVEAELKAMAIMSKSPFAQKEGFIEEDKEFNDKNYEAIKEITERQEKAKTEDKAEEKTEGKTQETKKSPEMEQEGDISFGEDTLKGKKNANTVIDSKHGFVPRHNTRAIEQKEAEVMARPPMLFRAIRGALYGIMNAVIIAYNFFTKNDVPLRNAHLDDKMNAIEIMSSFAAAEKNFQGKVEEIMQNMNYSMQDKLELLGNLAKEEGRDIKFSLQGKTYEILCENKVFSSNISINTYHKEKGREVCESVTEIGNPASKRGFQAMEDFVRTEFTRFSHEENVATRFDYSLRYLNTKESMDLKSANIKAVEERLKNAQMDLKNAEQQIKNIQEEFEKEQDPEKITELREKKIAKIKERDETLASVKATKKTLKKEMRAEKKLNSETKRLFDKLDKSKKDRLGNYNKDENFIAKDDESKVEAAKEARKYPHIEKKGLLKEVASIGKDKEKDILVKDAISDELFVVTAQNGKITDVKQQQPEAVIGRDVLFEKIDTKEFLKSLDDRKMVQIGTFALNEDTLAYHFDRMDKGLTEDDRQVFVDRGYKEGCNDSIEMFKDKVDEVHLLYVSGNQKQAFDINLSQKGGVPEEVQDIVFAGQLEETFDVEEGLSDIFADIENTIADEPEETGKKHEEPEEDKGGLDMPNLFDELENKGFFDEER